MTERLWLPSGARGRFDPPVEEVLDAAVPEARVLAEDLAAHGIEASTAAALAELGPDDAVVVLAETWGEFADPRTGRRIRCVEVDNKPFEKLTFDRTLEVLERQVVEQPAHVGIAEFGPCLYLRLTAFQVFIPLAGAPRGWREKAETEGYAILFPPMPSGDRAWVTISAEREPVPKAGRNERCPCGSGKKWKKCHGW